MKLINRCICLYFTTAYACIITCPTCVGRVSKNSAPFFSDDCYRSENNRGKARCTKQNQKQKQMATPKKSGGEK